MKWNSVSNPLELLGIVIIIALAIFCIFTLFSRTAAIEEKNLKQKAVVINLFNEQEVKLEGWMYNFPVIDVAYEWCLNHSIPDDQRQTKAKELVDRYFYTLSSNTISLKPLPTETKAETEKNP